MDLNETTRANIASFGPHNQSPERTQNFEDQKNGFGYKRIEVSIFLST